MMGTIKTSLSKIIEDWTNAGCMIFDSEICFYFNANTKYIKQIIVHTDFINSKIIYKVYCNKPKDLYEPFDKLEDAINYYNTLNEEL